MRPKVCLRRFMPGSLRASILRISSKQRLCSTRWIERGLIKWFHARAIYETQADSSLWPAAAGFYCRVISGYGTLAVTRKKVAGIEVVSLPGLLFWLLNRTSSSFCSSPALPFFSAASNAFMVGP